MMCSLKEWVEFGARNNRLPHPIIASTDSKNKSVNTYLTHCGFHDYVGRKYKPSSEEYSDEHIVKIRREFKRDGESISKREDEIIALLERTTNYSKNEIKLFCSTVILEVFLNVQVMIKVGGF